MTGDRPAIQPAPWQETWPPTLWSFALHGLAKYHRRVAMLEHLGASFKRPAANDPSKLYRVRVRVGV